MTGVGRPPTWALVLLSLKQVALVAVANDAFNRVCRDSLEPGKKKSKVTPHVHQLLSCHNRQFPVCKGYLVV